MKCPHCQSGETKTTNSRPRGDRRMRTRRCAACGRRFMTTEIVGEVGDKYPLLKPKVIKRSGSLADYERDKLLQSITVAVRKTRRAGIPIDEIIGGIEEDIVTAAAASPPETRVIGEQVMRRLRQYDAMAYLRYASVHQEMESPADFARLLKTLAEEDDDAAV